MYDALKIWIENYKNILSPPIDNEHHKAIPIPVLQNKLNLIVGENNIGKTNILRAMSKLSLVSSSNIFFNNKINNARRYSRNEDKPRKIDSNLDNAKWSFKLEFDLPKGKIDEFFNKSKEFTPDEYKKLKHEIDNFKSFELTFSGKLSEDQEDKPRFSHPFDDITFKKHQSWIHDDFYNEITKLYPEIVNLIDDISPEIETHITYTNADIDMKNSKFKYLSLILKSFTKNHDEVMNRLKELKKPTMSNNNNEEDRLEAKKNEMKRLNM